MPGRGFLASRAFFEEANALDFVISKKKENLLCLVQQILDEHGFCIVKGFFNRGDVIRLVQTFKNDFSAKNDLRWTGPYKYGMPDFQRLDLGDYAQINARFSRMFTNYTWNKEGPFAALINEMINFRNQLFSLTSNSHIYNINGENYCDLPKVLHYPVGGGFMNRHSDNNGPTPNVLLSLTKRGTDYFEGGVYYIDKQGNFLDAEEVLEVGDLYLHVQETPHGVRAVDPKKNIDLVSLDGRLAINLSAENFLFEHPND